MSVFIPTHVRVVRHTRGRFECTQGVVLDGHTGFQRATPHTPHHDHNPQPRPQRHTTNQTTTPINQHTHTQQKHNNTLQHHIGFLFYCLPFCLFCPSFPFFVFLSSLVVLSVPCFLFLSLSSILCLFLCSPLFPMMCLVSFLCL